MTEDAPNYEALGACSPREFSVGKYEGKCNSQLSYYPSLLVFIRCNVYEKKGYNSDAVKEVNAKGETSTLQTGKDTNIVREIYQLSRFNDYDSLRKQSLVQISAVRTGVFAYMNGTLSPVMQIEEHVF